ncbi:Oplophorus-luciferin 2-monooxygenase non-catalytic subunit [Chionoecetes opilio]|uniref:Oplophorus-luciferin 2-monooxygenase non-catalytic subunit n=1 Tax=Chionoecetes opilio TaxID=41210 RepID=A0A8J4XZ89_CHIOP|nr:Oplophorus-luciferin 2-monooxygenase non-catalytic subunit [Chionoecetes opilio]
MMVAPAVLSLLVSFTVLSVDATPKRSCPPPEDILPCVCSDDSLGLVLVCSGVKDEPELAQVFTANFPSSDFHELRILHDPMNLSHRLHSMEPSTLGEATFQRVNITGTQILSIDGKTFDKSKSTLQSLAFDGNRIYEFPLASLSSYTSLTTLLLANNILPRLQLVFSPFLKVLDVNGNRPLVVEEKAFENSPSLQKINLSNTSQQSLQRGLFAQLGQLHELDLSNNDLKELEEAAIVTAKPSLTYLDVSRNEISSISHDSIVGLATNATLVMEKNKITQLTQKSWQHIFDQLQQPYGIINLAGHSTVQKGFGFLRDRTVATEMTRPATSPVTSHHADPTRSVPRIHWSCGCDMAWIVLNKTYLALFTDTTTCASGERVIFLDPNIFTLMCPHV